MPAPKPPRPLRDAALPPGLGLINVPKSCDVLAERLQQQIVNGTYPAGSPLPTERNLVSETGLSRGSVREALRILEAQGLVRTRPGRYGGSVVAEQGDELLGSQIHRFAKIRGVPWHALVEVRQALEPMVAHLAAKNRTDSDLAELRAISDQLDAAAVNDVPRFLAENAKWHSALAAASHNDLLRAFTASISDLMLEASRLEKFASQEVRRLVTIAHRRILQAIEAKDADAARRRSERDVQAYAVHLEAAVKAAAATKRAAVSTKRRAATVDAARS
jgi:GntR family transcriptional regulator, transcriptional repressor for pyruvate dehydrogenase complex